jgi:hypothetical protein
MTFLLRVRRGSIECYNVLCNVSIRINTKASTKVILATGLVSTRTVVGEDTLKTGSRIKTSRRDPENLFRQPVRNT